MYNSYLEKVLSQLRNQRSYIYLYFICIFYISPVPTDSINPPTQSEHKMPPRNDASSEYEVHEDLGKTIMSDPDYVPLESKPVPMRIRWRNVALFIMLHIGGLVGLYMIPSARLYTLVFSKSHCFM